MRNIQDPEKHVTVPVRSVKTELDITDMLGSIRARLGRFRMGYNVEPGLYAVGNPDGNTPVFISANYKLSFDSLRRHLKGLDAYILVLDTKGINVWCAAGKGTFSTDEIVERIIKHGVERVVDHRIIIVPQLGAPGVQPHEVKRKTGFRVGYGPVYARDIPEFLERGRKATPAMRQVHFNLGQRAVLIPVEVTQLWKKSLYYMAAVLLIFGLQPIGIIFKDAVVRGYHFLVLGALAVFSGTVLIPLVLPFVPFRSFALKGALTGAALTCAYLLMFRHSREMDGVLKAASLFLFPAISSYLALNFTGSTPFTNLSGVAKEVGVALPIYYTCIGVSVVLVVLYKLREWGVL
jgi:hypothetical protein